MDYGKGAGAWFISDGARVVANFSAVRDGGSLVLVSDPEGLTWAAYEHFHLKQDLLPQEAAEPPPEITRASAVPKFLSPAPASTRATDWQQIISL